MTPPTPPISPITREQVREFELLGSRCGESLMRAVDAIPGNGQGYAYFAKGPVRATLSTNPYARWATAACGVNNVDDQTLEETILFFRSHAVPAVLRIVPDGFTPEKADRLRAQGLRHVGFHTVLWSPLPMQVEPIPSNIRIEHVTDPEHYDQALQVQLEGWGMPDNPNSPLLKLRRSWRTLPNHRMYLASLDGKPAAHAMLYTEGRVAYLENASTIERFRDKGLHCALIRRRINDAMALGCDTIVGGSDFESPSRSNQMRCGLQIAYLAALWQEAAPA
jgi:hypothetical protein